MRLFWMIVAAFRRDHNDYVEMSSERRQMNIRSEFLVLVLLLSSALSAQKLTPAQAAEILRNGPGLSNRTFACNDCTGPHVIIGRYHHPRATIEIPRRLDGTRVTDPITIYGLTLSHRRNK